MRGLIRIYDRYTTVRKDFNALHGEVQHLQKREKELDAYIQKIDTVEGKDYEIRKKLDVVKPGEKILYIVDTP